MNTFFGIIQNQAAILNEDESLHCVKVLRHKVGDIIRVIDGKGTVAIGKIEAAHAKQCAVSLTQKQFIEPSRNYKLHIAIAPTKNIERIEWFVEKAVEIGIDEISFLKCKNSERTVVKDERIIKVAESAVKQSQQAYVPKINAIIDFKSFIQQDTSNIKLIAHCADYAKTVIGTHIPKQQSVTVLIGPEGDFSNEEIQLATDNQYQAISLGNTRLRTETAGLYVCNAFSVLFNNY
ncbi:MAG: 16S rRNA (uracil(1498)-N(3))-methyltransferase [Bacteroidia bacterium]|nr:16S rRNA (uracil(1498)-N(3))-methyltransferase [Bacteroidia bacterium]